MEAITDIIEGNPVGVLEYALFKAIQSQEYKVASYLISQGVNVNIKYDNRSLLCLIIEQNSITYSTYLKPFLPLNQECIKIVTHIISVIDINEQDVDGKTCLMKACSNEHTRDIAIMLITHPSIDINIQDYRGNTALMCASEMYPSGTYDAINIEYRQDVMKLLIYHGADINVTTYCKNFTALNLAGENGRFILSEYIKYISKIKMLLKYLGLDNLYYIIRRIIKFSDIGDFDLKEYTYK